MSDQTDAEQAYLREVGRAFLREMPDGKAADRAARPGDPSRGLAQHIPADRSRFTSDDRTPAEQQHDMALFGPCWACRAEHPGRPPVARMTVTRLLPDGGVQSILTCPEGHGE